jgi:Cys-tRNA(Pro) deacylase
MSAERVPGTPAVLQLRAANIDFTPHFYSYEEKGGTAVSSRELGVDEHAVVKTLVMADDKGAPLMVLMHGDRKVSTKALARIIDVKAIEPCAPDVAQRHSGYRVGGTSPFGTRKRMPVYVERTVLELPAIYINGGSRGFLVRIAPQVLITMLAARPVEVAIAQ